MESVLKEPIEKKEEVVETKEETTAAQAANVTPENTIATEELNTSDPIDGEDAAEDDVIDFGQVPHSGNEEPIAGPSSEVEKLKAQLSEATATINSLQGQLSSFESLSSDPLVKLWNEYRTVEGDSHSIGGFFKKVGAVSTVDGQDDETLVRMHFEKQANELGLEGDEFTQAVEDEVYSWANEPSMLKKKSLVISAKKALAGNASSSLEAIEADYRTKREAQQREQTEWLNRQKANIHSGVDNMIGKRFNGRVVTTEWANKVKSAVERSGDIFNPDFVRYTAPDKNGVSDLLVEDVVRFIDTAVNREELFKLSKKTLGKARAENLEEKAVQAHNTGIVREVSKGKALSEDDAAYERAMQRQNPNFKL